MGRKKRKNEFCFKFQGSGAAGFKFQVSGFRAAELLVSGLLCSVSRQQGCWFQVSEFQDSRFRFFKPVIGLDFKEAMNLEIDLFRLRLSL